MLVDEGVALRIPDELDVVREVIRTAHGRILRRHRLRVGNGLGPEEDGEGHLDGVLADGEARVDAVGVAFAGARVRAGKAYLTGEEREHGDRGRLRFAVHAALRSPALGDEAGLRRGDFTREALDRFDGNVRDAGRPFGRLRRLVGAVAENVGLVVASLRGGLREGLFVVAHAVLVKEGLIDEVFLDHDVGHARGERRVGARTDRHPFGVAAGERVGADRVDHDHAGLAEPQCFGEFPGLTAARSARDGRVVPERDVELGVLDLTHVGADARIARANGPVVEAAEHEGPDVLDAGGRIVGVPTDVPADQIEEPEGAVAVVEEAVVARAVHQQNRLVRVLLDGVLEARADFVQGLVPRDALEFAFASLARALHRELQAFGRIEALTDRAAAVAGADLRELTVGHARLGVARVVGFNADDASVLRDAAQEAAATAVDRAGRPCDGFDVGGSGRDRAAHRRRRKAGGGAEKSRASQKASTSNHKKESPSKRQKTPNKATVRFPQQ